MSNLWVQFQRLIPARQVQVGEILSVDTATHTSIVQLVGGGDMRVRGDSLLDGDLCYIENGAIVSQAPALPAVSVEVL